MTCNRCFFDLFFCGQPLVSLVDIVTLSCLCGNYIYLDLFYLAFSCDLFLTFLCNVADPEDPYVLGIPGFGSESINTGYGSGSALDPSIFKQK